MFRIGASLIAQTAAAIVFIPVIAKGVPLPDPILPSTNTVVTLMGTTATARPELNGNILASLTKQYGFISAVSPTAYFGSIESFVVKSDLDGTLDFYWHVIPTRSPLGAPILDGPIGALRIGGFNHFALDADWRIDGPGNLPPTAVQNFGDQLVDFGFNPQLAVPNESFLFFLDTQATEYAEVGTYYLQANLGNSQPFSTFAPVPEPSGRLLCVIGLGLPLIVRINRVARGRSIGPQQRITN